MALGKRNTKEVIKYIMILAVRTNTAETIAMVPRQEPSKHLPTHIPFGGCTRRARGHREECSPGKLPIQPMQKASYECAWYAYGVSKEYVRNDPRPGVLTRSNARYRA